MPLIVNLSSIFKVKAIIPDGIYPFVKLCNDYATSRCLCSKTLFGMSNFVWVSKQLYTHQKLIREYKLGKISDDQFLSTLLRIFSFLKDNKKVEDPKKLLAEAWNQIIVWDEAATAHLKQLLDLAKSGVPVYLISNTNSLNIDKIISLFSEACPEGRWDKQALQTQDANNQPIAIAPNVYLCLSYRYGLFKEGTPGLLTTVVKQLQSQELTVISQFSKDMEAAQGAGHPQLKAQAATDFYEPVNLRPTAKPALA